MPPCLPVQHQLAWARVVPADDFPHPLGQRAGDGPRRAVGESSDTWQNGPAAVSHEGGIRAGRHDRAGERGWAVKSGFHAWESWHRGCWKNRIPPPIQLAGGKADKYGGGFARPGDRGRGFDDLGVRFRRGNDGFHETDRVTAVALAAGMPVC